MWQLVVNSGMNLVGKVIENKFIRDVAINKANNEMIKDVLGKSINGAVILGGMYLIIDGIKYVIDKENNLDIDVKLKDGTNGSIKINK